MVQKDKTLEVAQPENEPNPSPGSVEACVDGQGSVEGPIIGVERTGRRKFISGVVEGEGLILQYM